MGDQVREAAVRRGGVRVVLHGEAEVPDRLLAGLLQHVLACAHRLDDGQGEIGKAQRVGLAAADQELLQRNRIGIGRQRIIELARDRFDAVPPFR